MRLLIGFQPVFHHLWFDGTYDLRPLRDVEFCGATTIFESNVELLLFTQIHHHINDSFMVATCIVRAHRRLKFKNRGGQIESYPSEHVEIQLKSKLRSTTKITSIMYSPYIIR
jgi:hypothetical protein